MTLKVDSYKDLFIIALRLTGIGTIITNNELAGDHIFQVWTQYSWVWPQYLRVLSQSLQVLSRWIHPMILFLVWTDKRRVHTLMIKESMVVLHFRDIEKKIPGPHFSSAGKNFNPLSAHGKSCWFMVMQNPFIIFTPLKTFLPISKFNMWTRTKSNCTKDQHKSFINSKKKNP